jgi:hypothetical protein
MNITRRFTRIGTAVLVLALCAMAAGLARAESEAEIKKMPGYVEFEALKILGGQEAKIEVYLKDPMLNLVAKFVKEEDPELFDILSKLKLVRVQVFDITREVAREMSRVTAETAKELDGRGWERIVRVREDYESVDVYLKPTGEYDALDGIVVMVIGEDDEAIFVNIVGNIHPDDVSKLGAHFDIDELDDVHYDRRDRDRNGSKND